MKQILIAFTLILFANLSFVSVCAANSSGKTVYKAAPNEFSEFEAELDAAEGTKKHPRETERSAPRKASKKTSAPSPLSQQVEGLSEIELDTKIKQLQEHLKSSPQDFQKSNELARLLYHKKNYHEVGPLLWKNIDKLDKAHLYLLARAHTHAKEFPMAHKALNLILGKFPNEAEAYTLRGDLFSQENKKTEAIEAYQAALDLKKNYGPAYEGLVVLFEKQTPPNLYELRIIYQDMIKHLGPKPQYLQKICEINFSDSVMAAASTSCRESYNKNRNLADAHVYYGASLIALGDIKRGLPILKNAAQKFSKSELAQFHYGSYLEENKNFIASYEIFKTGTKADEKSARSWLGLANAAFEIQKYEEALAAYKKACALDRKTTVALRKATASLRATRNSEWISKYQDAGDNCLL